jgi:6-phosphofructokinase 1
MQKPDLSIPTLGACEVDSPIELSKRSGDLMANYVHEDEAVLFNIERSKRSALDDGETPLLEQAGPREKIFFEPSEVRAGIVTCGGLCPGLNDVIRSIVMSLWYRYGAKRILGFRFGYRGLVERFGIEPLELTPREVTDIHKRGGTILGSSRGYGNCAGEIVDTLQKRKINMLFTIGGDGTQRGALGLADEIARRGLDIAIVGIPKTIDNDLSYVARSFGFDTAVSTAVQAVASAHIEAYDAINGIGLVKVMGRQSGFIAACTALANSDVNFVLLPEVPFDLEGPNGLLHHLEERLERRHHAVILVAEGAGQDLMQASLDADASGNIRLGDIGIFLKDRICSYFDERGTEVNLKYIDPSYIIRSQPANANDSVYCQVLGTHAVHAAMAGKTRLLISLYHQRLVHIPILLATSERNCVDPEGGLWRSVIEATGQPVLMKN